MNQQRRQSTDQSRYNQIPMNLPMNTLPEGHQGNFSSPGTDQWVLARQHDKSETKRLLDSAFAVILNDSYERNEHHLYIYCTECGCIGHGDPIIDDFKRIELNFNYQTLVWYDKKIDLGQRQVICNGKRIFLCPNCSYDVEFHPDETATCDHTMGHIIHVDKRLSLKICYNPWQPESILDEDLIQLASTLANKKDNRNNHKEQMTKFDIIYGFEE